MQFSLRTLFLLFFVIASAFAAFGVAGFVFGPYLIALVMSVRIAIAWRSSRAWLVVGVLLFFVLCPCLLLPAVSSAREAARLMQCANYLKQIVIAVHNYDQAYGCLPPAFVADAAGRPSHSWRVLVLPYLESRPIYDAYRFDEPWNGPNNRKLAVQMPYGCYQCPSQRGPADGTKVFTSYVAITGPGTAWPGAGGGSLAKIRDSANTILLVEVDNMDISWMEPRDLTIDQVLGDRENLAGAITSPHQLSDGYFVRSSQRGGNVVMADGRVYFLHGRPSPEDLADLLRVDGPKRVKIDNLKLQIDPPVVERIRWDHIVGLPLFVVSFLLLVTRPLPKRQGPIETNPQTGDGQDSQRNRQDSQD